MFVCFSVCSHISKTTQPNFNFTHVACGFGPLVAALRYALCTSGFVVDILFHVMGSVARLPVPTMVSPTPKVTSH